MSFLSDASYRAFLEEHIGALPDALAREHVVKRFEAWRQQYGSHRLVERAAELLTSERDRPTWLYLRGPSDLECLRTLAQRHRFDARLFRGFLAADSLWGDLKPEWFSPFSVCRASDWRDPEGAVVVTLSDDRPFRDNGRDLGNDFLTRFIDESRLSIPQETRRKQEGRRTVLYVDYRKVQTLAALSEEIRKNADFATVLLVNSAQGSDSKEFDAVIEQPFFYLWPLVFRSLAPDLFHVNVGWGTQGLPFAPFVPEDAIIDFYDLLTFVRDDALDGHHSEPLALTRSSEKTLFERFHGFVHRCSETVSDSLAAVYPGKEIVSVTEYLREPLYESQPARGDGIVRLVYGGLLVQEGAGPEDPHYRNFFQMVKYYCGGNLHLYLYPSPYLYGFGAPKGVEELIRQTGRNNIHACMPLAENDFVREITRYDFGMCMPTPEGVRPTSYGYVLPSKFITYLRAGLPIVVPEDQTFIADLVRDHGLGVVYGYDDCDRMPDLLNRQDIGQLKKNVVRFRSSWAVNRGGAKVSALYDRILGEKAARRRLTVSVPNKPQAVRRVPAPASASSDEGTLSLEGRQYLSEQEYTRYLEARIERAGPSLDREYVRRKQADWSCLYHVDRMAQRAGEMLAEMGGQPCVLYLDDVLSLHATAQMLKQSGPRDLRGFVVEDDLLAKLDSRIFGQYPVYSAGRAGEVGVPVFSVSGRTPAQAARGCLTNDYREKFIDLGRFDPVRETRRRLDGHDVVLYPLYREIHTVGIMAAAVRRRDERLRSIGLSPRPLIDRGFDETIVEPCFYLWPLIFQIVEPSLVHLNVGWGIQALPLSPYIPDRRRTVIDFYEVLGFLSDAYFSKTHSTASQVRGAEEHFVRSYDHAIHLCSEEISTRLAEKYDSQASIVSVTEYLQEPVYSGPSSSDGLIRLVYGGCMLASTNPDDLYYRAFMTVAPHFARENLHLYIYNNPYIGAAGENDSLKEVIRRHGLVNIHSCAPLPLEEFVRKISEYDYGTTLLRPKDMDGADYNYFMAYKFLSYLRAGLPVVIDSDNHYMAGLVERYKLGIVLQDRDLEDLPRILNAADLASLKQNVVEFRNRFSIDKGSEKVLKIYREILEPSSLRAVRSVAAKRRVAPARVHRSRPAERTAVAAETVDRPELFQEMIDVMARRENRLYYRDQSARTMCSLASLARQLDPSVIVELGTLGGLSLRTWIASTKQTRIYAVDLSFQTLRETMEFLPADLSRVTLLEQDILQTDFSRLWTAQDKVIFFIDAHDLPNVPIMKHVLDTALPSLPDGSLVIVDDLWFSEERLTPDNAKAFLEDRVCNEIDELQCFHGHYAPYHEGGSFMGFAEAIPLQEFVNRHGIPLVHEPGSKHVFFVWEKAYLSCNRDATACGEYGSVHHNPLESVPVSARHATIMQEIVHRYRQKDIRGAAEGISKVLEQDRRDPGLSYGLAVCLARVGLLSQARDVLAGNLRESVGPRYRRLYEDLVRRTGASAARPSEQERTSRPSGGLTIFAMPKAFTGHTAIIQKNAIRSWARLDPRPEIILFGDEPGIREMADEVGARHVPVVGRNEFGTPLVDQFFQAAQERAAHEVLAYVNADMILLEDFLLGVQTAQERLANFLLIGQRWDLPVLDEIDFRDPQWRVSLQRQLQEHAMLHAECGLDYFVFRKGLWPQIPPFAIGRTAWDNWLVMDPRKRGIPVIDGTEWITAVHQDHAYGHVAGGRHEAWNGVEATRNRTLAGPADHHGLTTGATWLLRADGSMVETGPRQPRYIGADYRNQRSAWLIRQAGELLAVGARELAACKCEEAMSCMDGWLELRRMGCIPSGSDDGADIAGRYVACHTLLAQCYMQMGLHEQAVAACSRLLANPNVRISEAQRQSISQMRDRLVEGLQAETPTAGPPRAPWIEEADPVSTAPVSRPVAGVSGLGSRPRITVVTACRNGQRYLKECVNSILGQTLTDWELILIDDGSTDGTRRMIEEFARSDPRIQACHFPDNRGPYVRRNFAIRRAAADFIVIQDADDIMFPTKLQRLYEAITRDAGLGIVGSAHRTFLETFRGLDRTEYCELPVDHETIVASCASWRAALSHGTAIVRKSLFDTIGLYDENPFAADAFWSAKLALYSQIGASVKAMNLPEPLTLIRVHPSSQTQTLPVFDPRGRRVRYRHYCECKLRRIREKWMQQPDLDVAAELRNCSCSDFLVRFKAKIIEWESQELAVHFVNDLLTGALSSFGKKAYVSCVIILNGLEVMRRDLPRQVKGFDLLRALSLCGSGLHQRGLAHLDREIEHHDNPLARRLLRDLDERGDSMDVQDWFLQNAPSLELRLPGEERERIRVAMT